MGIERVTVPIARKMAKMTQADLAAVCGVSVGTVSSWENYKTEPTVSQAIKIAQAVNRQYDEIIFLPEVTV